MNPYVTARRSPVPAPAAMSRIDLVLALYDGAIERLTKAHGHLKAGRRAEAVPLLARAQLIVTELAAGVRLDVDADMGANYLRLYDYVVDRLRAPRERPVGEAVRVLETLREGFAAVRDQAVAMERRGEFASADRLLTLCETA